MDPARLSDGDLARRLQGDAAEEAFTALYHRYVRAVFDFVGRTVRDLAASEDITQRAFIQAWEQRAALRDPDAVKPWLYRIANNLALNHVTRAREATDIDAVASIVEAPDPEPEAQALAEEAARLVWDAAASLEPRQRTVLELAVRAELTSPEIAQVMEIEPAQASLLVHRAKEALGNAVRYLLVARRRTHCERLAEMVPAGVLQLTAEQRASVDRHMRRCESCQGMATRLTSPEALLGSLVMLPLPRGLEHPPHLRLTAATIGAGAASFSGAGRPSAGIASAPVSAGVAGRPRRRRRAALGALLLVLLLGSCGGIIMPRVFGGPPPSAPVIGGVPTRTPAPSAVATTATPSSSFGATPAPTATPSPTPTPVHSATPTPRPPTPTPAPEFTVASISLCFVQTVGGACNPANTTAQACSGGTISPASCPYQITFTLTPGRGGTLAWSLSGTAWTSCNSSLPVTASGTVTVPTPAPSQLTITPPPLMVTSAPNRANAASTSKASVTTAAWPGASHNVAGFYGLGCG